jgi:hypothetical protein
MKLTGAEKQREKQRGKRRGNKGRAIKNQTKKRGKEIKK